MAGALLDELNRTRPGTVPASAAMRSRRAILASPESGSGDPRQAATQEAFKVKGEAVGSVA
jgi:hypothetical protein